MPFKVFILKLTDVSNNKVQLRENLHIVFTNILIQTS
jgi:hypothetical protein